jgi:hypothetical protein
MAKSTSYVISLFEKATDELEEMEHIPASELNKVLNKIDDIIADLEDCSTEYGEESLDDDENEDDDY